MMKMPIIIMMKMPIIIIKQIIWNYECPEIRRHTTVLSWKYVGNLGEE